MADLCLYQETWDLTLHLFHRVKTPIWVVRLSSSPKPDQTIHCWGVAYIRTLIQYKLLYLTHTSRKTKVKTDFKSSVLIRMLLENWPLFDPHQATCQGKIPEGLGLKKGEERERTISCFITILHRSLKSELQTTLIPAPHLTASVTTIKDKNKLVRCLLTQDPSIEQVPLVPLTLSGIQ